MWVYKVIGAEEADVRQAIFEVIEGSGYTVELSNTSSGGRYVSFNVALEVRSEKQRTSTYEALKAHSSVRMVL